MEIRGIVVNQAKESNFIRFPNEREAIYHKRDARRNKLVMKTGDHLLCRVREIQNYGPSQRYEILSYKIVNPPDGWRMNGITPAGLAKIICPLRFLRLEPHPQKDRNYLLYYNKLMENVHDYDRRSVKTGMRLDIEMLKQVQLTAEVIRTLLPGPTGKNGWVLQRVIENDSEPGLDYDQREQNGGGHSHSPQFDFSDHQQPSTMELRGIVMNQASGFNFVSFSNNMEAAYHMRDARKNNLTMKLGDHLLCVVKDLKTTNENETPRCEILRYQTVPTPAGWGKAGQSSSGLAKIICPLSFLRLSHRPPKFNPYCYPIYCNELMEIVHDYDMRTVEHNEVPDVEKLKYIRLTAEVTRTRIPECGGRNGIMLHRVVEKYFEPKTPDRHLVNEPTPSLNQYSKLAPERRNHSANLTIGFLVKKWGLFLVVWLVDRRLAIIDTRDFQPDELPELGTFVECDTRENEVPVLDGDMFYGWEIINIRPYCPEDCNGIAEHDKAMVFCRELQFESYRLVEKTRQAHFSHSLFGSICDQEGVFSLSPKPGDFVEAYIKAVPSDESTLQWIIADPKMKEERSLQKRCRRDFITQMICPEITESEEPEQCFSNTSGIYSTSDLQSSTSYGMHEEIRYDSSTTQTSRNSALGQSNGHRKAKTYEELVKRIIEHPEISRVVLDVNMDLFAEIRVMDM